MIPAIVLTAGLATRLRPLSSLVAKAAMPVAGRSLVERILGQLTSAGVTDAVLNLHHLGHTITTLVGDGHHLGLHVRYSWETTVLGSGGGPARAFRLLDAPRALILNGDTLTDLDLAALTRDHEASGALVTLAVVPNQEPDRYGGIRANGDGVFEGLVKKGDTTPSWHFVGVHVADRAAYDGVAIDTPSESLSGVYAALAARQPGRVRILPVTTSFVDIGTPGDYLDTCLTLATQERGSTFGSGVTIDRSAVVSHSVLWDGVVVEEDAMVERCILTSGTRVPRGMSLSHSIVSGPNAESVTPIL